MVGVVKGYQRGETTRNGQKRLQDEDDLRWKHDVQGETSERPVVISKPRVTFKGYSFFGFYEQCFRIFQVKPAILGRI